MADFIYKLHINRMHLKLVLSAHPDRANRISRRADQSTDRIHQRSDGPANGRGGGGLFSTLYFMKR